MDQHALARLYVGQMYECVVRGGEDSRDGGGFGVGPVGGHRQQQPDVAGHQGAAAVGEESEHRITDREFGDTGADLDDHARAFAAEQRVVGEHA
ncbi:Uncharacterised protein [Mycobacterium tuberculosis]|nr:Uncharacterised protein [Mycobacterium tuberculosis]CEZ60587.1 Uncharacterised protein [Mycobacterium tuberculosis]CFA13369.1 Uncharacterised protein [Mycobacterium tuberculosis]CFA38773.1 Uncharacterised protein [Mycobacterium tuberculosis]CFA90478.1 Uncharacterised protein [Mycobacterium tuberculosis]